MRRVGEIRRDFTDAPAEDSRPFSFCQRRHDSPSTVWADRCAICAESSPHADLHVTVGATEKIVQGLMDRRFRPRVDLTALGAAGPDDSCRCTRKSC